MNFKNEIFNTCVSQFPETSYLQGRSRARPVNMPAFPRPCSRALRLFDLPENLIVVCQVQPAKRSTACSSALPSNQQWRLVMLPFNQTERRHRLAGVAQPLIACLSGRPLFRTASAPRVGLMRRACSAAAQRQLRRPVIRSRERDSLTAEIANC
jgi:hypothetical protein